MSGLILYSNFLSALVKKSIPPYTKTKYLQCAKYSIQVWAQLTVKLTFHSFSKLAVLQTLETVCRPASFCWVPLVLLTINTINPLTHAALHACSISCACSIVTILWMSFLYSNIVIQQILDSPTGQYWVLGASWSENLLFISRKTWLVYYINFWSFMKQ